MKANDIICFDTQKTRIENDLDVLYGDIMTQLDHILCLFGLDEDLIENKLNCGKVSQTEFDFALIDLIYAIKYKGKEEEND